MDLRHVCRWLDWVQLWMTTIEWLLGFLNRLRICNILHGCSFEHYYNGWLYLVTWAKDIGGSCVRCILMSQKSSNVNVVFVPCCRVKASGAVRTLSGRNRWSSYELTGTAGGGMPLVTVEDSDESNAGDDDQDQRNSSASVGMSHHMVSRSPLSRFSVFCLSRREECV